ncbi:amidohydrolase family protein [Phenylobacterium sp.]|uniref:amidohydrolase family protein n=1 Tax=Phenylobacterium sp. TaxID=1871053 RepID=UPI002FE221FC
MILGKLRHTFAAAILATGALAAGPALAQGATVLRNFTLIDGSGRAAQPDSALVIGENGRIDWVGPSAQVKAPAGARTVDLRGKYVMPGLIDLHVHVGNVVDLTQDYRNFTRANVEKDLKQYAAYGVTTVLAMGTEGDAIFPLRAEQRATGRPSMARVYTAGQGVVFKGGYGGVPGLNQQVATPDEARRAVDVQADKGVDLIKLWLDDELGTMPKMPPEVSAAVIDQAHKRGLKVLAHIFYLEDAKRVVGQGVDGLVHSVRDQAVDQALIDDMKRRGTWQLAETLSREASMFAYGVPPSPILNDPFFAAAVSPAALAQLRSPERQKTVASGPHFHDYPRFLETAKANLKRLSDAGVKYGFGTDSGPPGRFAGYFSHWELALMVESGATPAEAIRTATGVAAEFLGAGDLGTLEAGKWADLVVLGADPLADIRNSRRIEAVYVAGRPVPPVRP